MKHVTATHATRSDVPTPGLPPDALRWISAGLRSAKPERRQRAIDASLAARAFAAGFARGADPLGAGRRHVVDDHHEHWLVGHAVGRYAAVDAAARYLREHVLPRDRDNDASTLTRSARRRRGSATSRPERARAFCAT